jgi:hypothetical protein
MRPGRPLIFGGAGLAAALLGLVAWPTAQDGAVHLPGFSAALPALVSPARRAQMPRAAPAVEPPAARPGVVPAPAVAAGPQAVSLHVAAPQQLQVGETQELIVSVGPHAGVGEIGFTLQFDANVLQVRAGLEGDWAAGAPARFVAEISGTEDRIQVRSTAAGRRTGSAGGSVAVVQFQALAPGGSTVLLSDVVVKDGAGQPMAFALAASHLLLNVVPPAAPRP